VTEDSTDQPPLSWCDLALQQGQARLLSGPLAPPPSSTQRDGSHDDAARLVELLRNNGVPSDLIEVRGAACCA